MFVKDKKLVIVGTGKTAGMAYEYFTVDSEYEVVAFSVNAEYIDGDMMFCDLPVVPFERLEELYPPEQYFTYVAISYVHLNRDRTKMFLECKKKGYTCASYVSSHCFIWRTVKIGENTFIYEDNTIQHLVEIGNNVTLWSGNHIGHETIIEDNVWLTSHDAISGCSRIGKNTFIGVNATVGDFVTIAEDTILAAGALTVHDITEKGGVWVGSPVRKLNRTAYEQFDVPKELI